MCQGPYNHLGEGGSCNYVLHFYSVGVETPRTEVGGKTTLTSNI